METTTMAEKLEYVEEMTTNVDAVQERVLTDILARNGDAEYLTKCGLAGGAGVDTDRATFQAKVPLVTYEDMKPYILRVANGDTSPVLTGPDHLISEFVVTTGTSGGEPKLIPAVKDELGRRMLLHSLVTAVMNQNVPGLDKGSGLYFYFVKSETTTPGGLPARTVTTSLLKSDQFKSRPPYDPSRGGGGGQTSPAAAVLCEDASQSMYAQMLCGLRHRRAVQRIGAAFAYGLVRAVSFLQRNWRHLAADIEAGALVGVGSQRVTDPSVRAAVAGVLRRPDPELARFIRTECSKEGDDCWAGILTRLWPNAKYLDAISTGTMAQYVPTLRHFSGGLPIVSTVYGSSECYFGLNLRPMSSGGDPAEASYTIMPNMAYFEFLPTNAGDNDDDATAAAIHQLVELAGVEAGREYELVVTTYGGLYRYRVGDVLRVVRFHNAAPELRFVRRRSVALSVDVERTVEAELQRAVERASAALLRPRRAAVLDYTARACTETVPGHYVVYWELLLPPSPSSSSTTAAAAAAAGETAAGVVDGDVLGRCCLEMEEALNFSYREGRVGSGAIGALEIRVVRPGTFEEVADYALVASRGASVGQYKVPRCVTVPAVVELLDSRVVSSNFSPAMPHWESGMRFEEETTDILGCNNAAA